MRNVVSSMFGVVGFGLVVACQPTSSQGTDDAVDAAESTGTTSSAYTAAQQLSRCPSTKNDTTSGGTIVYGSTTIVNRTTQIANYLLGGKAPTLPVSAACTAFKSKLDVIRASVMKGPVKNPLNAYLGGTVVGGELRSAKVLPARVVCATTVDAYQFEMFDDINGYANPLSEISYDAQACFGGTIGPYMYMVGSNGGFWNDPAGDLTYTRLIIDPEPAKLSVSLTTAMSSASAGAPSVGTVTGAAVKSFYVPTTITSTLSPGTPCSTTTAASGATLSSVLAVPVNSLGVPMTGKVKCVAPNSTLFPPQ